MLERTSSLEESQAAKQVVESGGPVFTLGDFQDNLVWSHVWPSFKQEIGPETSLGPFQPEWFSDSDVSWKVLSLVSEVMWRLNFPVYEDEVPGFSNSLTGIAPCEYCMYRKYVHLLITFICVT